MLTIQAIRLLGVLRTIPLRTADGHILGTEGIKALWPMVSRLEKRLDEVERERLSYLRSATKDIPDWAQRVAQWEKDKKDPDSFIACVLKNVNFALETVLNEKEDNCIITTEAMNDIAEHMAHIDSPLQVCSAAWLGRFSVSTAEAVGYIARMCVNKHNVNG